MKYFQLEPIIRFYSAYHFILMTWKHSEWNPRPLNRTWNLYKCPSTVWIFIVKILVCIPNVVSRRNFFFFFFFFSLRFHSTSQNCGTGNSLNTVNSNISPGLCLCLEVRRRDGYIQLEVSEWTLPGPSVGDVTDEGVGASCHPPFVCVEKRSNS